MFPEDWKIINLAQVLTDIDAGKSPNCPDIPAGSGEWGVLKVSAVHPDGLRTEENKVITNPNYINEAYEVKNSDLLITRANTPELVGLTCLVQNPRAGLLLSDKTLRLKVNRLLTSALFISKIMQMPFVRSQIENDATGSSAGMKNISQGNIRNLEIPLPGLDEQEIITSVLSNIDSTIAHTSSLIAKLKQMKAGLLHDLLTRGLDENGKLRDAIEHPEQFKDSPLGQIPQDWEVRLLSTIAEVNSGVTLGRQISGLGTVELPYLRVANVQDGYLDLSDVKTIRVYKEEIPRFLLQAGDVLMNEGGDYDKLGRGTIWRGQISPCLHQNHVFRVRPNQNLILPEFLSAISGSAYGKRFFVLSSKQSTNLASINSTQLKLFPIPCPSILEQKKILDTLNAQNTHVQAEEAYLNKLKEQKKGLMHDLLTGRVRVTDLKEISA